jgi:hypothetical protein
VTLGDTSAGDSLPADTFVVEVRVSELRRLFNAIDPSPFHDKDLDPNAEDFIVDWAKEAHRDARLGLLVHLDRPAGLADEADVLRGAVHEYFNRRAQASRRRLRLLLRTGRTSLIIGVAFLGSFAFLGDLVAGWLTGSRAGPILREGFLIGGWVAMWRPIEIFLYDWWPIRAEARLFDRLGAMPVRITYAAGANGDAWRHDWPISAPDAVRPDAPGQTP